MRFKIVGEHRNYFSKELQIEFEDVFTLDQIGELSQAIDLVLAQQSRKLIETASPLELYKVGRDTWRHNPTIEQFVTHRTIGEIAAQLFNQKSLQLAFTQTFRTTAQTGASFLPPSSLRTISCIQPLAGAALISLKNHPTSLPLLPKKPENIVFISPELVIPWDALFQEPDQTFLLIAFGTPKSLYLLEKHDLHTHDLKKLGYAFGDRIKSPLHPVVFSKE